MAPWQWVLLAVPAIVLLLSVGMIARTLMGATADPGAAPQPADQGSASPDSADSEPVELGGEFDDLFVSSAEPSRAADSADEVERKEDGDDGGSRIAAADESVPSDTTVAGSGWHRPAEPEPVVPQRAADSPS
ncbi:hypothetical protein HJ590_01765 [Naumannella sp. ID2617S]|nr:hypothetical protein [Naumannella sp. ID2617S]